MVAGYAAHRARSLIEHIDADNLVGCVLYGDHALPEVNRSPERRYPPGDFFPHLTRSEFGIQESLNQTGFRPLLSGVGRLRNGLVSACPMALATDKPLMRCAPHSAEISPHGTPQTFSV